MKQVLLYPLRAAKKRKLKGKDTSNVYLPGNHRHLTQIRTNLEFTYNDSRNYGAADAFSDLSGLFLGGFSQEDEEYFKGHNHQNLLINFFLQQLLQEFMYLWNVNLSQFIQKTVCEDFLSAGFRSCFQQLYAKIAHEQEFDKRIETVF